MAHGGARPNSGRKKGTEASITKARREMAEKAAKKMIAAQATPLEIMGRVMAGDTSVTEMQFEAAKAAAPYIHPKLSAVTMNATVKRSVTEYSDDELAALAGEGEAGGDS